MLSLLRDLLIWLFLACPVVGAALLFRRYFPRESCWFAFLIPALGLVMLLNFVEHLVALPVLLWLLPLGCISLLVLLFRGTDRMQEMIVPAALFLFCFAFSFGVRLLDPDIHASSDGASDLNLVLNYCQGEKIPPTDGLMPPFHLQWYYSYQHYAASVVKRLLNVDLGTGTNAANALLGGWTAFLAAGIAHRLTGGRIWITLCAVFFVFSAFTGASPYIWLFIHDPSPWLPDNLSGGYGLEPNPLWHWLGFDTPLYSKDAPPLRLELQVPGWWMWRDEYHANASGHLLTFFTLLALIELFREERTNWPWICLCLLPPLAILSTLWSAMVVSFLCLGGLLHALYLGKRPQELSFTVLAVATGLISLWPALGDLTTAPQSPDVSWVPWRDHTPLLEFLISWWPALSLWLIFCFCWRSLPVCLRWVHLALPLLLIFVEMVTIESGRYNMVEKTWGCIYGTALFGFFPLVARQKNIFSRLLTGLLILTALISLTGWLYNRFRWVPGNKGVFHLEADAYLQNDSQKHHILQVLSQLHRANLLTGRCEWNYNECPLMAVFTENRCYSAWFYAEDRFGHDGENRYRERLNNDFYAGNGPDPLGFLKSNAIAAVIIWPQDQLSDAFLTKLKTQVAPDYTYIDCREDGSDNAGVFLRLPLPAWQN